MVVLYLRKRKYNSDLFMAVAEHKMTDVTRIVIGSVIPLHILAFDPPCNTHCSKDVWKLM
jgi:hypothetical protein